KEGYLPLAIINYLARLGHYYGHDQFLDLEQLSEQFKIESLSTSPAKYNPEQLLFWQKRALENMSLEEIWDWLGVDFYSSLPAGKQNLFLEIIKPNILFPEDAKRWSEIIFGDEVITQNDLGVADAQYL